MFIYRHCQPSRSAQASGLLIIIHGLATFAAGYFPCDVGCLPDVPSSTQVIHNAAGSVLFLSLLLAQLLWITLAVKKHTRAWFGWFTLICVVVSLAVIPGMGQAIETGEGFGFYQRINYGVSLLWMFVLAYLLRSPFNKRED